MSVLGCVKSSSAPPFAFGGWWVTLEGEHIHWLKFFGPGVLLGDGTWASRLSRPRSPHFPSVVSGTTRGRAGPTGLFVRGSQTPLLTAVSCLNPVPEALA